MKDKVLREIKNAEEFISGELLSEKFGMTRSAIWKYIKQLKEDGYEIESVTKKGYKLKSSPDILTYLEIEDYLETEYIGRKILYFDEIESTNSYGREHGYDLEEGTLIIGEVQSKGRGRMGRDWISPKGKGIWMTLVLKPKLEPQAAQNMTLIGAAALGETISKFNIDYKIKWPNDILLNDKKIAGILTEMNCELGQINYILMGIGVNVNLSREDLAELFNKASSLKIESNREIDRKKFLGYFLNEFEELYEDFIKSGNIDKSLKIIRENSLLLGEEVRIIRGQVVEYARALDINQEGHLLVEKPDGKIEEIYAGEVSLRGKEGYVN